MKTIYVCGDSIEGIFSAVYDAWRTKKTEEECGIALRGFLEQELFCEYVEVTERKEKMLAVEKLICKYLGLQAYHDIYYALLADDAGKGDAVLGTMLEAKKIRDSRRIMEHLGHPKVAKVFELSRKVENEAHLLTEFIRFRELENGVLYAPVTPKAQVLTCIAPHFADRFPLENWMIHDKTHKMYAVHEARKQWVLAEGEETGGDERFGQVSEKEQEYARLWKSFCDTIAIQERENPVCQRGHLPLRFRPNMTEFRR